MTASAVVVVGNLLALVTPLATDPPRAFVGSIVASSLLGLVFTARNLQLFRATGAVACWSRPSRRTCSSTD